MKILHVVPTYYPAVRYGGPIRSVHGLASTLAAQGHDVHVYTTNVDGQGVSRVPLDRPTLLDGVSVWYFETSVGRRIYRSPGMRQALSSNVASFDIVHFTLGVSLADLGGSAGGAEGPRTLCLVAPRNARGRSDPS